MNEPEQSSATRRLYPIHDAEVAEDRPVTRRLPRVPLPAVVALSVTTWMVAMAVCIVESNLVPPHSAAYQWWVAAAMLLVFVPIGIGLALAFVYA